MEEEYFFINLAEFCEAIKNGTDLDLVPRAKNWEDMTAYKTANPNSNFSNYWIDIHHIKQI